jgi:hypothetical protein
VSQVQSQPGLHNETLSQKKMEAILKIKQKEKEA